MLVSSGERVLRLHLESVKLWGKDGTGDRVAKLQPEEKIIEVAIVSQGT
jgi:DNA gyrase subunit A